MPLASAIAQRPSHGGQARAAMPLRQRDWLNHLRPDQLKILRDREWLVLHFQAGLREGKARGESSDIVAPKIVQALRQAGHAAAVKTLWRWRADYRVDGLFGLMDNRWFKDHPDTTWPFIAALSHIYLRGTGVGKSIEFCHAEAMKLAEDYDWPRCPFRVSRRWINEHLTGGDMGIAGRSFDHRQMANRPVFKAGSNN